MQDYSSPEYKDLYKEILIDYNYRFPKFHPIPYPLLNRIQQHEQQRNAKTSK